MVKVAVLGAGINGVTCALRIKEKYPDCEVVLISKEFSPNTTGDGSGGLWYPYLCGTTPETRITKWGSETYAYLLSLWQEGGHDISLMPMFALYREPPTQEGIPSWADKVFGYHDLTETQLKYLSSLYSTRYVSGHSFTTFIVQPPKIIQHLLDLFKALGGEVRQAEIKSLRDASLDGYPVVVNCTGLGARTVVPDERVFPIRGQIFKANPVVVNCTGLGARTVVPDGRVFPIRGQIFKVAAPWINVTVVDQSSGHYIIPNAETCVLGGTHQENDFNTNPDQNDSNFILDGCRCMIASLNNANIATSWVGLRPGRDEVRLDAEERDGRLYIHNYGHGGSGLTLFWGCGIEVVDIFSQYYEKSNIPVTKSKL